MGGGIGKVGGARPVASVWLEQCAGLIWGRLQINTYYCRYCVAVEGFSQIRPRLELVFVVGFGAPRPAAAG